MRVRRRRWLLCIFIYSMIYIMQLWLCEKRQIRHIENVINYLMFKEDHYDACNLIIFLDGVTRKEKLGENHFLSTEWKVSVVLTAVVQLTLFSFPITAQMS